MVLRFDHVAVKHPKEHIPGAKTRGHGPQLQCQGPAPFQSAPKQNLRSLGLQPGPCQREACRGKCMSAKMLISYGKPQIVPRHRRVIEKGTRTQDWRVVAPAWLRKCPLGHGNPQLVPKQRRVIEKWSQCQAWRVAAKRVSAKMLVWHPQSPNSP